jgi:tetratricopeptide (TPR) repeat protein
MDFNDLQILPPSNWDKFEELCCDIFRALWKDPYAKRHGRQGQGQYGTDIWGYPQDANGQLHGVQCKAKDALHGGAISESELEAEVEKALKFEPALACWLLVTTAPRDASIEAAARRITIRHAAQKLFPVRVFGWEDLRSLITDFEEVMNKHYPDQSSKQKQILDEIKVISQSVASGNVAASAAETSNREFQVSVVEKLTQISVAVQEIRGPSPGQSGAAEAVLHARMDDARNLIRDYQPNTAFRQIERLIVEYWENSSDFAKFRLLANKAAALFNLGKYNDAARISLEALPYAPADSRAIVLAAQGHVVLGEIDKARSLLDDLLSKESNDDDALALRIATSIDEKTVTDPFWKMSVPDAAGWNVVLSAARWYIHRGRHEEGIAAFKKALAQQPERPEVMAETASATLELLFRDKAAMIGHRFTPEQFDELQAATKLLEKAWDSVKNSEIRETFIWAVLNLCSALRYLDRTNDLKIRIAEAVAVSPGDRAVLQHKALLESAIGEREQLLRTLDAMGTDDTEACLMRSDALVERI